jgi:hypothetical protein
MLRWELGIKFGIIVIDGHSTMAGPKDKNVALDLDVVPGTPRYVIV